MQLLWLRGNLYCFMAMYIMLFFKSFSIFSDLLAATGQHSCFTSAVQSTQHSTNLNNPFSGL